MGEEFDADLMDLGRVGKDRMCGPGNPLAETDAAWQSVFQHPQCFFEQDIQGDRLLGPVCLAAEHEHLRDQVPSPSRCEEYLLQMSMGPTVRGEER
jgi:hypothetical protein